MEHESLRRLIRQIVVTLQNFRRGIDFTYRYRLWEGFWQYGWVGKLLVGVAIIAGIKFLTLYFRWFSEADRSNPMALIASMGNLFQNAAREGYDFLFQGGMKYVLIILLEVIIFHVCRRTLALLTGDEKRDDLSFDAFIRAQVRIIKVSIRSWLMESIAAVILKIFFGIFGFMDFLQPAAIFLVQCYYFGFAVLDNYHEQFGLSIQESARLSRQYVGVALTIGLFLQAALSIPVAGAVAGPFLAAVTVTLTMYQLSDLHLRPRAFDYPNQGVGIQ